MMAFDCFSNKLVRIQTAKDIVNLSYPFNSQQDTQYYVKGSSEGLDK